MTDVAVFDTEGTLYQWVEPLEEESQIQVTTVEGNQTIELFASLIAMTNGAIFDVLLLGDYPQVPTLTAATDTTPYRYNPRQARVPKGNKTGGNWMDTPGGVLQKAGGVQDDDQTPSSKGMNPEWFTKFGVTVHNAAGKDMVATQSNVMRRYTPDEKLAVLGYQSKLEFHAMRDAYKAGVDYHKGDALIGTKHAIPSRMTGQDCFPLLESAMGKARLAHSTVLYRGMKGLDPTLVEGLRKPGYVLPSHFYVSTTTDLAKAKPHGAQPSPLEGQALAPPKPDVVLDILAPKGTRIMADIPDSWVLAPTVTMTTRMTYIDGNGVEHIVMDLEDT